MTLGLSIGFFGCGEKEMDSKAMEKAFATNKTVEATPAPVQAVATETQALPESQMADASVVYKDAVEALKKNDLPRAAETLMVLRSYPNLTPAQWLAANEMMGKLQTDLAARAERGDKIAQQTLENFRKNKRR